MVVKGDNAQLLEKLVQKAVVFQNGHPAIGAQQEVHPHGQHDQHHGHPLEGRLFTAHPVADGIAHEQADNGGDDGQLERADEHLAVAAHLYKVAQGKAAGGILESVNHHDDDGSHHENRHPHHVGHGEPGELILHPRSPPHPAWQRPAPHTPRSRRSSRRTYRNTRSSS